MQRCGSCGVFVSVVLHCASRHFWQQQQQQRQQQQQEQQEEDGRRSVTVHGARGSISGDALTMSLLGITTSGQSGDGIPHSREPKPTALSTSLDAASTSDGAVPQLLRALLLKNRKEFATHRAERASWASKSQKASGKAWCGNNRDEVSSGEAGVSVEKDSLDALAMDPKINGSWLLAFHLFSDAVQHHAVVPSIEHINVLLGITVRERRWQQMEQVEAFVDRLLVSAHKVCQLECEQEEKRNDDAESDQKLTVDREAIHKFVFSLQPTWETYDWLMAAAVSQRQWVDALTYFQDARDESLPVSDVSLRLALQALQIGGVHSAIGMCGGRFVTTAPLVPLRTSQRGPLLRRAAAAVPMGRWGQSDLHNSSQPLRKVTKEAGFLWEVALMIFSSFRHRVEDSGTVALFMSMMLEAGKHRVVLETFLDCRRTLCLGDNVLSIVSNASREVGDWAFNLRLLQHSMETPIAGAERGVSSMSFLEDALYALRQTRQHRRIMQLHVQIPSFMWTSRARAILAQAAMAQRNLPLLLRLLEEEADGRHSIDVVADCAVVVVGRHTFLEQAVVLPGKQMPVELYNAALSAVQVELIHRRFCECPTRAGMPHHSSFHNLAALSVTIYEQFLHLAKRQLREHDRGVSEHTLSVYAPLVRLLVSPSINDATSRCRSLGTAVQEPWEIALSHVARIRKPDTVLVSLATHLLLVHHQWEASFALLTSVARDEAMARIADSAVSHSRSGVHRDEVDDMTYLARHACPVVTAVAVRHAVWSAARQPSAAMHLIQLAFSRGWIDSCMALELLTGVNRGVDDAHRCECNQQGSVEDASHSPRDDTVAALFDLISLHGMGAGVLAGPFASILFDAMQLIQQLQTQTEPPTAPLHALFGRLNKIVTQLSGEMIAEARSDAEMIVTTVLHAVWQQVGVSHISRWTLWKECLCCLQWFRNPLMRNSSGVLHVSETTLQVLHAFMRRCDRPEEGFVEGLILGWLLADGASPLKFEDLFFSRAVSPPLADRLVFLSQELMLEALVWSSRHRARALLRRIVGPVKPLLLQLLQDKATACAAAGTPWSRLYKDALSTVTVVVQCVTSGPHEDVLHDWPLVQTLMLHLLQVPELTMVKVGAGVSVLADGLAAVLDKLRRSFHFLIVKISLDAHRRRSREGEMNTIPPPHNCVEPLVESGALEYMDLCEAFIQRMLNAGGGGTKDEDWLAHGDATTCLDKILNCIWDINYTLCVWCTLFSPHSSREKMLQGCIKDRYRRLLCMQVSFLPALCTTQQRVKRWLVVMSANNDTTMSTVGVDGGNHSATLVNDITTLEAWQKSHPPLLSQVESPRQPQQFVVPLILDVIHDITLETSQRFSSSKEENVVLAATPHEMSVRLSGGSSVHSVFEDHLAFVVPQQLRTMQQAGCTLIYVMLCEGRAELPHMVQKAMSWFCCSRRVLIAILEAVQSASREVLVALWTPLALVTVFEVLGSQSRFLDLVMKAHSADGSQAAALVRLLTTSPAIRAIARVDEAIYTAALLALVPDDVAGDDEPAASLRHTMCRFLCAFPKIVENRLLSMLLEGQLHDSQLHVLDTLMQYTFQESKLPLFRESPALIRATSKWILFRFPHGTQHSINTHVAASVSSVFTEIMLSTDPRPRDGFRMDLIRERVKHASDSCKGASGKTTHIARVSQALGWKQALELLAHARLTATSHVDLGRTFLLFMDIYGTRVPTEWRERFFVDIVKLQKQVRPLGKSSERCSLALDLIDEISDMSTPRNLLLLQQPVELSELQRVGEKIWNTLSAARYGRVAVGHNNIWNLVFGILQQELQNRSSEPIHVTGWEIASQRVSLSCLMLERLAEHLLRRGVRVPSARDDSQWHVNLPLVASSLLLLVELAVPGRAVLVALYTLYNRVLSVEVNSNDAPRSDNISSVRAEGEVWRSLLSCEVQLLTLPLLVGKNIYSGIGSGDTMSNALSTTEAMTKLLFRFTSEAALRLEATNSGVTATTTTAAAAADGATTTPWDRKILQDDLLRLLEVCGQRIASSSSSSVAFLSDTSRPMMMMMMMWQEYSEDLQRIARWYVQSALLMGAWKDIYWLALRLLTSMRTALLQEQEQQQQELFATTWRWVVGLLPAMVASSVRTSSSLQPQILSLVEAVPAALLQQICLAVSALDGDSDVDHDDEERRKRLRGILIQLHQRVLVKAEALVREEEGHAAAASFLERLSLVQPLVQLGMLLGVQHADTAQKASLRGTMLFFLLDNQWLQLVEAVKVECERDMASKTPKVGTVVVAEPKVTKWQEAVAVLCRQNKMMVYPFSPRSPAQGEFRVEMKEVRSALHALHVSCIVDELPWRVAMELFCRTDGLPHVTHVFTTSFSELVVRSCPSWRTALRIMQHSLSTVPYPTRVQQLLARLILQRMRTDSHWEVAGEAPPQSPRKERGADRTYGGVLSWEVACWCYHQLTRDATAPPLPQRNMLEILRHCVFHPDAALSAYEAYWKQKYRRTEGVNVFLSLLRAGRVAQSEQLTLRAMRDYIRCCDEHDRVVSKECGEMGKYHVFTAEGNTMVCRAFTHACISSIVSQEEAAVVAAALKQRGRIGEMEELVMVSPRPRGDVSTRNNTKTPR